MDGGRICNVPGLGCENVALSLDGWGGARRVEANESAEDWLEGRSDALLVHSTAQIPFRMSWRGMICAARVEHRMPWLVSMR